MSWLLTRKLRKLLELLLPLFVDLDLVALILFILTGKSELLALQDQLLGVLGMLGGQDGEEVPVKTNKR